LTSLGRTDLAYAIATQDTAPSWGWMVKGGATTMWESWFGDQYTAYGSRNHIMFGSQTNWYFSALAGINMAPLSVGWTDIFYRPDVNGLVTTDLTSVTASLNTHRGLISSEWTRFPGTAVCDSISEGNQVHLKCFTGSISKIDFASYGLPSGTCGNYSINPDCNAKDSVSVVAAACLGKTSCVVDASNENFHGDPCLNIVKRLSVQVSGCTSTKIYSHTVIVPVNSVGYVYIPKFGHSSIAIEESQQVVWQNGAFKPGVPGVSQGTDAGTAVELVIGSGRYTFEAYSQ